MLSPKFLVAIFVVLFICNAHSQIDALDYKIDKRIILQKGLSQSRIISMLEDERGFMWFGTADGLNRYDGYTFKIFRSVFNDSTSLPNNTINAMVMDKNGNIWLGTNNGVVLFNPYTETFKSLRDTNSANVSRGANIINSCVIDKQNNVWCATKGYGVFKINTKTFAKEHLLDKDSSTINFDEISTLYVDTKNRLWIGSFIDNVISAYSINDETFEKYIVFDTIYPEKRRFKVHSVYEDDDNRIWIGLMDYFGSRGSLVYLEKSKTKFVDYKTILPQEYIDNYVDRFNTIGSIIGDKNGNIWFASVLGGIYSFKFGSIPQAYYRQSPTLDAGINSIYMSSNQIMWIGTNGNGIEISVPNNADFNLMNPRINSNFSIESIRAFAEDDNNYWVGGYFGLSKIKKDFSEIKTIDFSSVYSIANCPNNPNCLWTGSEGGGLHPVNKKNNAFLNIDIISDKYVPKSIFVIHPVNDTLILLGTFNDVVGYNPVSKMMTSYDSFNTKMNKAVRTIYNDRHGNILIGYVQGGIGKFLLDSNKIEKFELIPDLHGTNDYNPINSIYRDKKNRYWIGTNNGLIVYNSDNKKLKFFTEADGLPNSHIYGILPDDEGNIWVSTNNGLSSFSPKEGIFRNFDVSDGLQNNEYNTGAYYKADDGTLFFGGINGFNYFNASKIKQNSIIPKIVITGIKISNKYVNIDKKTSLSNSITINSNEDVFTIEFAGLSFINSYKNKYKYRIEELSEQWITLGSQHSITFNNLHPGSYTLSILASNNHGLWTKDPFIFIIEQRPHFYECLLFKLFILAIIFLAFFIGYRYRLKRLTKQKNKIQIFADLQTINLRVANGTLKKEIIKHKATSQALEASNKTKDKFLSIIAHDIINPLGVILGFSDLLIDEANSFSKKDQTSFIKTINVTTKGLTSLLNNLLQWSRLQSGNISAHPQQVFLNNYIVEVINLLNANIIDKSITLQNNVNDEITVFADPDMLSTIFRNLLSNAIKFTPNKGKIIINADTDGKTTQISIIDNGIGIPNDKLSNLFNSKDNISTKGTNNEAGTGIGLGLVFEFVMMNGGSISVDSQVGKGSKFYFDLPAENKSNKKKV